MNPKRKFSVELKRQVVEQLLSGTSSSAQLCRQYEISASLLYHWKRQYSRGRYGQEPTAVGALENRIRELERLVGELTFENRLIKKAAELSVWGRNGRPLRCLNSGKSGGDAEGWGYRRAVAIIGSTLSP
jgi:transposase